MLDMCMQTQLFACNTFFYEGLDMEGTRRELVEYGLIEYKLFFNYLGAGRLDVFAPQVAGMFSQIFIW